MTDILKLTLVDAKALLKKRDISSVELTQGFLDKMERERSLNAYITECPNEALAQAKEADEKIKNGEESLLTGLPLGIKDLFCTKDIRTTAGSKMLHNFIPPYESTVTQNLLNNGAVFLGKTNMDEFAMGSANITSAFGPVKNPIKSKERPEKEFVPGGSSGGSAAAVKGNLCLGSIGSDTGGSIRQPASFCGLVGIKPTYGLCSRYGMIAFASSLDQAGPITHTVKDSALLLSAMAGYDKKDATSSNVQIPNYLDDINSNIKGLKIGIPKEYLENLPLLMQSVLNKSISWLRSRGAEIIDCSLPMTSFALPTYYIIAPAEASSNLARYDGVRYGYRTEHSTSLTELYENTRGEGFGDEVKRRVLIGTYVLSSGYYDAYYTRAQKIRRLIMQDFTNTFGQVDVLLTPTTPTAAFAIDEKPKDPLTMYLNDIFTVTVNLAGLPAISVPFGEDAEGLPLGLQFIAPAFKEQTLFNAALALEEGQSS